MLKLIALPEDEAEAKAKDGEPINPQNQLESLEENRLTEVWTKNEKFGDEEDEWNWWKKFWARSEIIGFWELRDDPILNSIVD